MNSLEHFARLNELCASHNVNARNDLAVFFRAVQEKIHEAHAKLFKKFPIGSVVMFEKTWGGQEIPSTVPRVVVRHDFARSYSFGGPKEADEGKPRLLCSPGMVFEQEVVSIPIDDVRAWDRSKDLPVPNQKPPISLNRCEACLDSDGRTSMVAINHVFNTLETHGYHRRALVPLQQDFFVNMVARPDLEFWRCPSCSALSYFTGVIRTTTR